MALSATGPRSIAVASCGGHLLVSASTGGAWNAFSLGDDGVPDSVAITRKETGHATNLQTVALPTPHGLTFSPHGLFALGTDPGSRRMTLLRPSPAGIEVLTRWETTNGLAPLAPAWTADGRYIIAANAPTASLSVYEIRTVPENKAGIHLLGNVQTTTPIRALLAHPSEPAVFTSRPQGAGSRLELWKLHGSHLRLAGDTWISGDVAALAQRFGYLWAASDGRLTRISMRDLRDIRPFEVPLHGTQAIITQDAITHRFANV
jgi:6-phosphogluconolactonase (cycloisomerase 2 family)